MHYYSSEIWENNVLCIQIFNNYNGIDITVAFLANGNCIACCQQQTNAMFLSRDTSHYFFTPWSSSAREGNRFSASQEIPHILWNPKVQSCIHTCPSPVFILCHLCPVYASTSQFLKVQLNITLPSNAWIFQVVSFFQVSPSIPCIRLSSPHIRYMPRPSYSSQFTHPNNIG